MTILKGFESDNLNGGFVQYVDSSSIKLIEKKEKNPLLLIYSANTAPKCASGMVLSRKYTEHKPIST